MSILTTLTHAREQNFEDDVKLTHIGIIDYGTDDEG
jgi:hypothetical protein